MTERSPQFTKALDYTTQFKRDLKRIKKRGNDLEALYDIVDMLCAGKELHEKNRNHQLTGQWDKYFECHIAPDWLMIYLLFPDSVKLIRTGTHADLFG